MALYSRSSELSDVPFVDKSKILIRHIGDALDLKSNDIDLEVMNFDEYHFVTGSVYEGAQRRLTKDWHNTLLEEIDETRFGKCATSRKTYDEDGLEDTDTVSSINISKLKSCEYEYITESCYEGQCSKIGMEGHGIYTFPHGVVYEGQFKDGMFHGKGILVYPQGQALNCTFKKGKITKWEFLFAPPSSEDDAVPGQGRRMSTGSEDLVRLKTELDIDIATYCKPPDRRFNRSYSEGMKGAPYENRTARLRERPIPEGCYDMEDGFYNPKTKWVHSAEDMEHILYMAPENPQDIKLNSESDFVKFINDIPDVPVYHTESWIKENCRKAWDENVGYKPELYEYWFSGRESERRRLNMRSREEGGKFITEESCCVKCLKRLEKMSKNYHSI